jgi:hypothetical protein
MRLLLGTFVPPLLVVLLMVTTPLGTGDGVHQADLLHPLLPHVHIVNGKIVTHQSADAGTNTPAHTAGPSVGGGAGSDVASAGLGLSPTVPGLPGVALISLPGKRLALELSMPSGRVEAPPDPPPTSLAR